MTQPRHGIDNTPPKYIILAGNLKDFYLWQNANQIRGAEALYVATADVLRGRRYPKATFITLGTFYQRPDHQEIIEVCRTVADTPLFFKGD